MKSKVTLSVVIPFYNHRKYLGETLESIAAQSDPADEIVIVDDGSTDGSEEYLPEFQRKYPSIRLIRNDRNRGIAYTFNRAVEEAKGECVVLCPADDLMMPGFFDSGRNAFHKYPDLGIFCGDTSLFLDRTPYEFKNLNLLPVESEIYMSPDETIKQCRYKDFIVATNSTIYRRELILKYGGYDPNLFSLMDTYLNYQIVLRHPILYKPQIYSGFRIVGSSYGHRIRFDWKLRTQLLSAFVRKVEQSEPAFRKKFKKAGIFSLGGLSMLLYLVSRPWFWPHLPFLTFKILRQKWKNFRSSKTT